MTACGGKIISVVRYNGSLAGEWDAFVAKAKNATFLFGRAYMDYNTRIADRLFE